MSNAKMNEQDHEVLNEIVKDRMGEIEAIISAGLQKVWERSASAGGWAQAGEIWHVIMHGVVIDLNIVMKQIMTHTRWRKMEEDKENED